MSYIGNAPITAAFLVDTFSGTGSQTAFTMTVAPANTSSILVVVTGVTQDPSTYSVSGTTLTFSAAPPSGTSNISVRYLGIPASGVTTTAYRTVTNTTATAGQTSFTIPSYTVGYVDVYRNGVYLPTSDYTASTGTTVVLNNAATAGDTITTVSFYVSSVLNAIPAVAGSIGSSYLVSGITLTSPIITGSTPQITVYTSGSGTYTTPTNARYLYIKMCGGGGGGGTTNNSGTGGSGGNTTFGTSLLTANGGVGSSYLAGSGGTATINSPASGIALTGGRGGGGLYPGTLASAQYTGGYGGVNPFGGSANAVAQASASGDGVANTGAGGAGAVTYTTNQYAGAGGGAGGYIEAYIASPSATYAYSVGAGGTAGTGGAQNGGAGGSGVIYIAAFF